jgi:beta-galactosidase
MKIGTYYYPEQWPRQQWERDFDNIAAAEMRIVHLAEFAWFAMEPRAGEFHFDWLAECLEMAAKRKLDVILCTPTAAPPIWLAQEHPQTLPRDQHGTPVRFGGRRHYSPTSPEFREATSRIVTAMADRFGDHPSVIGWQIDNEYGCQFDQSAHTHEAFREWLQRRYKTIDALNKAWGNQFWNTYYTDFDQILFPPDRDPKYANPHQRLDASRFWSWAFADFNRLQARILKRKIGKRFITTNFMSFHLDCDPADMAEDLTLFAWDSYPVTGWGGPVKDQTYRLADPAGMALVHEQMASYNGRWGMLEIQPGQVNWSGYPVLLYPGVVRLWLWTAFAHGAEFVTVYRWRQPRFGIELFHHGLNEPDGVTLSPGGRQFKQTASEVKALPGELTKALAASRAAVSGTADDPAVGIVLDFTQLWYYASLPQAKRWKQDQWLSRWYASLARLGLRIRVITDVNAALDAALKLVIVPGVQMVDEQIVGRWEQYAAVGGHLVLTCRTALMDLDGQTWEGPHAAPIRKLMGASIRAYDGLPEETFGKIELGSKSYSWGVWGDLLDADGGTQVLGKYADQFYAGSAAITRRATGSGGQVTYCGVYGEQDLIDALAEDCAVAAGLKIVKLPARVHLHRFGRYRMLLNHRAEPVDVPAPAGAKFLLGSAKLEAAGVAIWEQ